MMKSGSRPPRFSSPSGIAGAILAALCFCTHLGAAQVTLAWDPNSEPDVAGYRIYYGTAGTGFNTVANVGNFTSFVVDDLQPGQTYAFYATCYNTSGLESEPSNVVEYTVPESGDGAPAVSNMSVTPGGLQMQWAAVPGTTYRVLYKNDLNEPAWQPVAEFVAAGESAYFVDSASKTKAHRFYRLEVVP
jgi:hypothetical protein